MSWVNWKDLHNDLSVKPPKMYEKQEEEVEKPDDSEEAAKLFTNKYATDIAKNMGIREERRLNLENAMYDAPEFNPFAWSSRIFSVVSQSPVYDWVF